MKKTIAIFIIIFALGVGLFFLTPGSLKKKEKPVPVAKKKDVKSDVDNATAALNPLLALVQSDEKMIESLNKAFASVVGNVKSSTARLIIKDANEQITHNWSVILSSGTQAIAPAQGLKNAKALTITLQDKTAEAELAGIDEESGLALLNLKQSISSSPLVWQNDCQAGEGLLLLVWGDEASKPWVIPSRCVGRGATPHDLVFYAPSLAHDALIFDLRGRLIGCYMKQKDKGLATSVATALNGDQISQIIRDLTPEKPNDVHQP